MALARTAIQVSGMRELDATLRTIDAKFAKKVVRKALRAGAKVVGEAVKATAPRRTGRMAKSFGVRSARARKGQVAVALAVGKKWFVGDLFYAGFIEFGWRVGPRRLGDRRRHVPGRHFVERAADGKAQAAVIVIVQTTRVELDALVIESRQGV